MPPWERNDMHKVELSLSPSPMSPDSYFLVQCAAIFFGPVCCKDFSGGLLNVSQGLSFTVIVKTVLKRLSDHSQEAL